MGFNWKRACDTKIIFNCFLYTLLLALIGFFLSLSGITNSLVTGGITNYSQRDLIRVARYINQENVTNKENNSGPSAEANDTVQSSSTQVETEYEVITDSLIHNSTNTVHIKTTQKVQQRAEHNRTADMLKWKEKKPRGMLSRGRVPTREIKPKYSINVDAMKDDIIKRAVSPSSGEPWPKPKGMTRSPRILCLHPDRFSFFVNPDVLLSCDILAQAVKNYRAEIEMFWNYSQTLHQNGAKTYSQNESSSSSSDLLQLDIVLENQHCTGVYPPILMDESYVLSVNNETGTLSAREIWGILRGLETFFQLLYVPPKHDDTLHLKGFMAKDTPAYPHRGLLLDTSRHFLSKSMILQNIEAMRQNKLNVLHWHMVDDQSFPFQSREFPDLWKKGAYAPNLVYSFEDINEIIDRARLNGIRVMPEFDTPGHTRGWLGQPGLLTECGKNMEKTTGVFDVTKQSTYTFLKAFYTELRSLFKDNMTHLGGDEVSVKCWYLNRDFLTHLARFTPHELLNMYFRRLHKQLQNIDSNWVTVVWEDVLRSFNVQLNPNNTWVEVWLDSSWVAKSMRLGLNTIYSGCWYLDSVKQIKADWARFYDCHLDRLKPDNFDPKHGRLMGGETCMWGEWVDDTNVIQFIWPRAIAPAERLWSNLQTTSYSKSVQARFQEQACRMWRRGIPVSPRNGPGHCSGKMPYDSDETASYSQWPEMF